MSALREAKALRADYNNVRVITFRQFATWPKAEVVEGVPVKRVGGVFFRGRLRTRYGAKFLSEAIVLFNLIRDRRTYSVIHLRQLGVMTRPALLAVLTTGKPLIANIALNGLDVPHSYGMPLYLCAGELDPLSPFLLAHDVARQGDFDDLRHEDLLGGLTLRMMRHRRVTFAVTSTRMRADLIRRGYRPEQIKMLPTGVDVQSFSATAELVKSRASKNDPPVVLCTGHLRYEKGVDVLLQAWRRVHAQAPGAQLVLAGQGPLEPQLRELCAALEIEESVRFAGLVRDIRSALAAADVFVLPSRNEGLPNALLEAMACGLPSIATRVSGSEDVIEDQVNGLLVPPENPEALATAILTFLEDRSRATAMGQAGQQRIVEAYNQTHLTQQLQQVYSEITSNTNSLDGQAGGAKDALPSSAASER